MDKNINKCAMSQVQLSVEEFNTDFQLSDSEIQKLLGSQWILPQSGDSSPTNHVSVPCDTIEFISRKGNLRI